MILYCIYSLDPAPDGTTSKRLVEAFERKSDAEYVLKALECVNYLWHCYQIIKEEKEEGKCLKQS